jgi:hypothetical protein
MGQALVLKTSLFPDGCREWRLTPDAQQTWANFKIHFARQERDRLETATTATAGYSGTAFATVSHPTPVPPHGEAHAAAATITPAALADLLAEVSRLRLACTPVPRTATPPVTRGYCWTHGSSTNASHASTTCKNRADGHMEAATWRNKLGGNPNAYAPAPRRSRTSPSQT